MTIFLDADTAGSSLFRDENIRRLGVPPADIEQEDRRYWTLPMYMNRKQIPPNLKALNYFRGQPSWLRNELQPDAYILTRRSFSWLYDISQADAIRARYPLRREYFARKGYRLVAKPELRKMGFKDQDIATIPPAVEVKSRYQG